MRMMKLYLFLNKLMSLMLKTKKELKVLNSAADNYHKMVKPISTLFLKIHSQIERKLLFKIKKRKQNNTKRKKVAAPLFVQLTGCAN